MVRKSDKAEKCAELPPVADSKRDLAAVALASGKSVRDAAAAAGVSERTLTNWQGEQEFRDRVRDLRGRLIATLLGSLSGAAAEAVEVLRKLLTSDAERVRLRAAEAIIAHALKGRDLDVQEMFEEIRDNLAEIERQNGRMGY